MAKEHTKKRGRPKKDINYETVEKLASIFCTQEEVASFLNISISVLQHDERFKTVHKKGIQTAKMSLRRLQWKHAQANPGMAMFLGKNYLGQTDKHEHEVTFPRGTNIVRPERKGGNGRKNHTSTS